MGTPNDTRWQELVAICVVAGDTDPRTICRYGGVQLSVATAALERAAEAGIVVDGVIDPAAATRIVGELRADVVADLHARIARNLMSHGPSRLLEAVDHARAAGDLVPFEEIIALAEHAARTSLSIGDYESARRLFELADEGYADQPSARAQRLCDLARALDGLGRVTDARSALTLAFGLAELVGDTRLATEAATAYALPVDWHAGDVAAGALLQRAEALGPNHEESVAIRAARSMVEMRIPIAPQNDQQLAWVTRASVAQPLAEEALAESAGCSDATRLLALLAWRSTHRSPTHLARRREASTEALDLSQRLRLPGRQTDAAVMLAVDSLESGDRPRFDEALTVLHWVADRDENPRLSWHAHTVAAGAALMESDLDGARHHRGIAAKIGAAMRFPGTLAAELILMAEELLDEGDVDSITAAVPDEGSSELLNPLGRIVVAHALALGDRSEDAERLLRRGLQQLDAEASYLLMATRAAAAAALLDVPDLVSELEAILSPWAHHVAVDSNAWWCDGPVALALGTLAHARGDDDTAWSQLEVAERTAKRMGDVRSLERVSALRATLQPRAGGGTVDGLVLTDRELQVVRLLVGGSSNREIAQALSFSPSTIRNDVGAIYRKLDVKSRPEAAAAAIALGLI